ncbi:hypothetical protein GF391_00950 [Candidatus Uhrbacteria bacterium]|nr:hypothetical protein [Candidatus Uhrbacteria bacterium]
MPRKKTATTEEAKSGAPKRARKAPAKRVSKAASGASSSVERPRILSAEEKRQLILAHAAERRPVDTVQRFSLWTGVLVCVLAITIGWLYTMRQSIAGAIQTDSLAEEAMDYGELKQSLDQNIGKMVEEIDALQEQNLLEFQQQAQEFQAASGASASAASGTRSASSTGSDVRSDLFQPGDDTDKDNSEKFELSPGISIDTLNSN